MLRGTRLGCPTRSRTASPTSASRFCTQLPRLYAEFEHALKERFDLDAEPRLPPFLAVGTWIGGDRDGNPYVTAAVLSGALAQQARLILAHYLEEVSQLYKELALSARIRPAPPGIEALAAASGESSAYRRDEPYRRAFQASRRASPARRKRWPS